MADKLVFQPGVKHYPHFLGAVVLQQVQNASGTMQERIIIDGQQRLRAGRTESAQITINRGPIGTAAVP